MVQIREATARLRLLLAEIGNREQQLDGLIRQFRTQMDRLPRQAIYGRATLDVALSAMAEIQERQDHVRSEKDHLLAIKQRATDELVALEVTRQVEEAKRALRDIKAKEALAGLEAEEAVEAQQFEEFIAEYSKRAERAITARLREENG